MRIATVAMLCAAVLVDVAISRAAPLVEGPWCGVPAGRWSSGIWRCEYWSLEECRAMMVAGDRGHCNMNPSYLDRPPQRPRKRKHAAPRT